MEVKTLLLEMAKRWQSQKISLCCAISEAGLNSLDFGGSFVDLLFGDIAYVALNCV